MTKAYYYEHVTYAVEIEYEYGGRSWHTVVGEKELNRFCKLHDDELSDIDLSTKQQDEKVRDFLNRAYYNTYHNPTFKGKSFMDVIDAMLS